ncbi:MAG: putative beta-lysine N-acetyltransferase [Acidobacteriota bacterium]
MTQSTPAPAGETNIPARVDGDGYSAKVLFSPLNQRIQVLEYEAEDLRALVMDLENQARKADFGKIFLKAPMHEKPDLEGAGMSAEAIVTGYFAGLSAVVMSLFLNEERSRRPFAQEQEGILAKIRSRAADDSVPELPGGYRLLLAGPGDAVDLAGLYAEVFASYPFPITDPEYIRMTMDSNVLYRIVRDPGGVMVAAASAEINDSFRNAEMTDFATLPDQRGLGLAQHILADLEGDMGERGIPNLYTIARARSAGMNRVFYNRGYRLTGTLVNNCHIAGQFEDMHVWCKGA